MFGTGRGIQMQRTVRNSQQVNRKDEGDDPFHLDASEHLQGKMDATDCSKYLELEKILGMRLKSDSTRTRRRGFESRDRHTLTRIWDNRTAASTYVDGIGRPQNTVLPLA